MIGIASFLALLGTLALRVLQTPAVAMAGILCLYGLKQWGQNSSSFFAQHRTVANLAVAILVVVGIGLRYARGACLLCRMPRNSILVLSLYAYAFMTLAWSPNLSVALQNWALQGPYILVIVVLAPLLIENIEDIGLAFKWTAIIGTVLCLLALGFGKWGSRGLLVYGDVFEQQTNPLAIASLGGTIFICGVLSLQKGQAGLMRLIYLVAIPIGIAVIFRSASRGQLVAAALAILVAWPVAYRIKNFSSFLSFAIGIGLIIVVGALAADYVQVNAERWSTDQGADDLSGRLDMAGALLSNWGSSPLAFLFGLGNSSAFHYVGFYPHISALEVLAEEGLVGIGLYGAALFLGARGALRLARALTPATTAKERAALAVLIAAFVFEVLLTLKQGSLLSCTYAFAYGMLLSKLELAPQAQESPAEAVSIAPVPRFQNLMR